MLIYLNGELVEEKEAKISVLDHAFLYGDGVYETLRTYEGRLFKVNEHINRLFNSANAIKLKIPMEKEELVAAIYELIKANQLPEARIRITVSRGRGGYSLSGLKCNPTVVISALDFKPRPPQIYEMGVNAITVNIERQLPHVKSLNFLSNVVARVEADEKDAYEALLVNRDANLTEGTVSNLFIVKDNVLITPSKQILEGVTRAVVLEIAKKSKDLIKDIKLKMFTKDELYSADECFITNTTGEIVPVVHIDNVTLNALSLPKPGPITLKLIERFREYVASQVSQ